jgi:hypothetical protein
VPADRDAFSLVDRRLDRDYLVHTLSRLARVPTDVPLSFETLMEPDDPKLVHYMQEFVSPELVVLGCYQLLDVPRNNMVAQFGPAGSGRGLLIQNYTASQHHNSMEGPFSGKISSAAAYGYGEPAIFGRRVSQKKAHQVGMLTMLKLHRQGEVELSGRFYWAVNNGVRNGHACPEAIIGALDDQPSFGPRPARWALRRDQEGTRPCALAGVPSAPNPR